MKWVGYVCYFVAFLNAFALIRLFISPQWYYTEAFKSGVTPNITQAKVIKIILALVFALIGYWLTQPKTYNDCMRSELKGQSRDYGTYAHRYCEKKFGKP